jgi:hypothetical protein
LKDWLIMVSIDVAQSSNLHWAGTFTTIRSVFVVLVHSKQLIFEYIQILVW